MAAVQTALILAGHGSHISPNTAGVVWRLVDELRVMGAADEVTAGFWKEQPSLHDVLDTVTAKQIFVVPVFTAQGFYTRSIIPAEMALDGPQTQSEGRMIHYAKTLGEHPRVARIVRQRVDEAIERYSLIPEQTAVAIIGHGTMRSRQSQMATLEQVDLLREGGFPGQVMEAYLDAEPNIPSIYGRSVHQDIVAVPFFLAPGSHVTIDVPKALGLPVGAAVLEREASHVYYTAPVGTDEALLDLVLDLAYDAGLPCVQKPGDAWANFPKAGWPALVEGVKAAGILRFGDLLLSADGVWPVDSDARSEKQFTTPGDLRQHVREEPFRPLASSQDLPRDWVVRVNDWDHLCAVVETVYPGTIAEWAALRKGALQVTSFEGLMQRQKSDLNKVQNLPQHILDRCVETICGRCTKHPSWYSDGPDDVNEIPCREVCNYWMSMALEEVE